MASNFRLCGVELRITWHEFSKARKRPHYQSSSRQNSNSWSISKQRRRLASPYRMAFSWLLTRSLSEATRLHYIGRRRDGGLAVFSARTASSEAGDRVLERPLPRRYWAGIAGISQGSGRSRLFRRPERDHRIQLGSRRV